VPHAGSEYTRGAFAAEFQSLGADGAVDAGGSAAVELDETRKRATPKEGFRRLGTMRELATQQDLVSSGGGNRDPPNHAPDLRGLQGRSGSVRAVVAS
jgi:hypothetical protein